VEAFVRKKSSLVIMSLFLLGFINCKLFNDPVDPIYVAVKEPQHGDILVPGESFMVVADIDLHHGVSEINSTLFSSSGKIIRDTLTDTLIYIQPYDSVIWRYDLFDEDVDFKGTYKIEKEITVPPDVPDGDFYCLQVNCLNWDGCSGYANTVMVSVSTPEMCDSIK
jgi:hypothetical protein